MNKHLLMATAAGAGLMAASVGVSAASFTHAGVWAASVSPTLYVAMVPAGPTSTDGTLLLEVAVGAAGLNFSYATPVIPNKDVTNVGGAGSASVVAVAWSNTDPLFTPYTTGLAGSATFSYALGSTSAAQMFQRQEVVALGTATSSPRVTCDVFFQVSLDAGNNLKFGVNAARPVNWASTNAGVSYTAGTGTATTGYTISSDYWNGGVTGNLVANQSTVAAQSTYTTFAQPVSVSTILTASMGNVSGFTNATYTTPAAAVNAMRTCANFGVTRNALTAAALGKIW
ncbi:hypothetical protein [Chitinimonas sp.]|uniref:hypothetical protein n=1 Tax=Chitinimonas sp. TaxID=1934313 RepID=UPI0035B028AF